jgi:hypothetical protein
MCSLPKCLSRRRHGGDLIIAPMRGGGSRRGRWLGTGAVAGLIQQAARTGAVA